MDLCIIRHAWAGQHGDPRWPNDDLRPLTSGGRKRFAKMARKLVKGALKLDVIATSPLVRCRQTADIVAEELSPAPPVIELDALRPGGDLDALLRWTSEQATEHRRIAWVGHAPDVDDMAAELLGCDLVDHPAGGVHFAKGAVALVRFEAAPQSGGGTLRWLVDADVLGLRD
jgi:phosphohistidine phosphatase